VVANIFDTGLPDDSVRLLYSRMCLSIIAEEEGGRKRLNRGLAEIGRLLAPGGIAMIDESTYSTGINRRHGKPDLVPPPGTEFYSVQDGFPPTHYDSRDPRSNGYSRFLVVAKDAGDLIGRLVAEGQDIRPLNAITDPAVAA
jgi:hypothetical protein